MVLQWVPEISMRDVAEGRADSVLPAYEPILSSGPVARYDDGEGGSLWGIFTYEEVDKAALDVGTFSSVTVPEGAPRILPLMADPPEHSAYKRLFTSCFRPVRIADLEARMRPVAAGILDRMIAAGSADFAAEYAYAFPTQSLCEVLALKVGWQVYDNWSHEMEVQTRSGMRRPGKGLPEIFGQITGELLDLIKERRAEPGGDVISRIVTAGLDGEPFSDDEVVGLVVALILAGRSTTASGIGNLVLRLAEDRALQDFLRAHPERIADAVEEGLRIDTPQQEQPRKATRDAVVGGHTIEAGASVFVNYGSANVDPGFWSEPRTFDVDRPDLRRHMAFGRGPHSCPGAPMGRMQIRLTVEELLARTESFELAGSVRRNTWPRLSVEELPLTFVAR
jgi:cytochrome P450